MLKTESQKRAFEEFFSQVSDDPLDLLTINCIALGSIIEKLLTAGEVTHDAKFKDALRKLLSFVIMLNRVKFYDFMAAGKVESLIYKLLRRIPGPPAISLRAHRVVGLGITSILVDFSEAKIPGFEDLGWLGADSRELTTALVTLYISLAAHSAPPDFNIEGSLVVASWAPPGSDSQGARAEDANLACRTYEAVSRLAGVPQARIVDVET